MSTTGTIFTRTDANGNVLTREATTASEVVELTFNGWVEKKSHKSSPTADAAKAPK